jgi:membrane associated rhomboid family serine protease
MNRRTLDIVLPGLYVIAILIAVFAGGGPAVGAVAAIGGILLGMYWAALRRNLKA